MSKKYKFIILSIVCFCFTSYQVLSQVTSPQKDNPYQDEKIRVLFILDASGSMNEMVGDVSRFVLAKDLLIKLHDSIAAKRPDTEFGLRIFGHRSAHDVSNCEDSALEIPFRARNRTAFINTLRNTNASGWTPIALSLFEGAKDFPARDATTKNVVILITDGLETCGGDPCSVGAIFEKERIALRPFIVGMGLSKEQLMNFDCIGPNIDGSNPDDFENISKAVVSYAIGGTSLEIKLIDHHGRKGITNLPVTIYDYHSKALLHQFIHTIGPRGQVDTLKIDPIGRYYIKVHTKPATYSEAFMLKPGEHNIIQVPIIMGDISITTRGNPVEMSHVRAVIKEKISGETVYMHDLQTTETYLAGEYHIYILTLPLVKKTIHLKAGAYEDIIISQGGFLNLTGGKGLVAGIYQTIDGIQEKVWEQHLEENRISLYLQPGDYHIIYRGEPPVESLSTASQQFTIREGGQTNIRF